MLSWELGRKGILADLRPALRGKIVVCVIAPMKFERGKGASAVEVEAGSAAQEAQEMLPDSQVVAAFQCGLPELFLPRSPSEHLLGPLA